MVSVMCFPGWKDKFITGTMFKNQLDYIIAKRNVRKKDKERKSNEPNNKRKKERKNE